MHSMQIPAGPTHTNRSKLGFPSVSNLPLIICWHLGCTVTFSTALTSHVWSCWEVVSGWGLARSCSFIRSVPLCLGSAFWPATFSENAVKATCPICGALHRRGAFLCNILTFYYDRSLIWQLIDSVSNSTAAVVESKNTRKSWVTLPSVHPESDCLLSLDI